MTPPDAEDRQPSVDRDELASTFLDGEASADEAARVEADPVLQARLAALRIAAETVAQPVPAAPAAAKETAIARALAEADRLLPPAVLAATAGGPDAEPPDELAAARRRREQHSRWLRTASIAAAIVLVVAAIPLLAQLGDGGGDADTLAGGEAATPSVLAPDSAGEGAGEDSGGGAEEEEAPTAEEPGGALAIDLGSIDSEQELAERAADLLAGDVVTSFEGGDDGEAGSADDDESNPETDPTARAQSAAGDCTSRLGVSVEAEAVATYQGEGVAVVVATGPSGPIVIAVDASCIVIARTEVEPR